MKFGDGIRWGDHAREILVETEGIYEKLFYKYNPDDLIFYNIKKYLVGLDGNLEGKKLLDIGCNIGRWVNYFRKGGFQYIGIDQDIDSIEIARKYNPDATFIHKYLWDMDFKQEFDVIVSISVMQHNRLFEKEKILLKTWQALKDGGILFIMESPVPEEKIGDTITQLTKQGWIDLIERFGFKWLESWHPSTEWKIDDCHIFRKIALSGGKDVFKPKLRELGLDEKLEIYIEDCYLNILGRGADPGGLRSYFDLIKTDRMKKQELPIQLRESDEYKNRFRK